MGKEASLASPITAGLGAGLSIYSAIKAGSDKKKARKALENLQTPELVNAFKDQQVSTLGSDLRKQESGRTAASSIDALRGAGARGIIGGIGAVQDNNNRVNAEIGANLDEQQKNIDANKAQDDVNIRGIKENRYQSDVAGLSSQINSANDGIKQGIGNAINGATTAASAYDVARDKKKGRVVKPVVKPAG
jgi:hypothetical protein